MKKPLTILVGVTGGIAAYKVVQVVRSFVQDGHDVHVIATPASFEFVGKTTWEAISRNVVLVNLFDQADHVRHVELSKQADVILVAPATANVLAKMGYGLADDALTTTLLTVTAPVVCAPAMHTQMWMHPATVENTKRLQDRGVRIVGPVLGQLTGEDVGIGRLADAETIVEAVYQSYQHQTHSHLARSRKMVGQSHTAPYEAKASMLDTVAYSNVKKVSQKQDLVGALVLVTAGGTREALDPVRYVGNRSSGRQGVALAQEAWNRGADVTLIAAHIDILPPDGMHVVRVGTALEMQKEVQKYAKKANLVIMAAAVADYRPASVQNAKISKAQSGQRLTLELVTNPDILVGLAAQKTPGQIIVGFAAETEQDPKKLIRLAQQKLHAKGCDYLVVNQVGWSSGFDVDVNEVVVLRRGGSVLTEASGTKQHVASTILQNIYPR